MAKKTFISYKYDEAQDLRNEILKKLGDDAKYYQGETSDSPDLSDASTERIKEYLKDMIFNTSVTIVIISPRMKYSQWIDWEIEYALREYKRGDITSKSNGLVGVIMKVNGSTDWLKEHGINVHGTPTIKYRNEFLYPIISSNRYNSNPEIKHCSECYTYDYMNGSYITLVDEDDFLVNPTYYIDNAFEKSKLSNYILRKER
ncbi:TIR domain-containing protein [Sphingobacterium multivorum]|uniref:TIR domain-containing protein n=1 Tax=Sphingobacterium multivorum TaxID=28454 RepID=UPI0028AB915A|nr:TIR domain-containing protein [Sphingobacterium multivorum]